MVESKALLALWQMVKERERERACVGVVSPSLHKWPPSLYFFLIWFFTFIHYFVSIQETSIILPQGAYWCRVFSYFNFKIPESRLTSLACSTKAPHPKHILS